MRPYSRGIVVSRHHRGQPAGSWMAGSVNEVKLYLRSNKEGLEGGSGRRCVEYGWSTAAFQVAFVDMGLGGYAS